MIEDDKAVRLERFGPVLALITPIQRANGVE
jgi:hypothetical protein